MIGEKNYLKEVKSYSNNYVTFGDGVKRKITRKGKLNYLGLSTLDDVLLVKSLITNLTSISQLCDQELCVNFNCSECIVTNKQLEQIMKGIR